MVKQRGKGRGVCVRQGPDVHGRPGRGLAPETRVADGTYARGPARPEERARTLTCYEYFNLLLYESGFGLLKACAAILSHDVLV